jgi:hypothetical protein
MLTYLFIFNKKKSCIIRFLLIDIFRKYLNDVAFMCSRFIKNIQDRHLIIFDSWNIVLVQCRRQCYINIYIYKLCWQQQLFMLTYDFNLSEVNHITKDVFYSYFLIKKFSDKILFCLKYKRKYIISY